MRRFLLALGLVLAGCAVGGDVAPSTFVLPNSPIARCMNLGSALEAEYEGQWGYKVRRADLVRLKQAGFDTIRLPVRWSAHMEEEPPYTLDPAMLARVDEIIDWAVEIDLNIIVNVHHFRKLNDDPDANEPVLEAIWDQLATHYAGAPENLIFETINEPNRKMTVARTDAINVKLLNRIRQDHPDRWVILGTADWGQLEGLLASDPQPAERVMLTYHEYRPFRFTHQGAPWTDQTRTGLKWGTRAEHADMKERLDQASALQSSTGMPIFLGEFGVFRKVPIEYRARWTKALREGAEARGISWCYWDYTGELQAYRRYNEAWIPEIKAALLD